MAKISKIKVGEVTTLIVLWLKEYSVRTSTNGFVVGISGGIDSAVTSALCARTGLPTLCIEMPILQDATQVSRGKEHLELLKSKFLNVKSIEVDLTSVFDAFRNEVATVEANSRLELSLANTRARLRMTTLYYFAGLHGALVVGTGNKVEDFGVGFYTKYGDGGVDLSPIADLMKSDVFALGKFLDIPKSIQNAAPTDGLFGDSRTDEEQIGASYDELEWAMIETENNKKAENFLGREKQVFEIYSKLNQINQHKMNPSPVCSIPKNMK